MTHITPAERAAALAAALKTLDVILQIVAAPALVAPEPVGPSPQEQEILDLFEPGAGLTGMQIAQLLGDGCDNGTLRTRLASMVRRGLLINRRPGGYYLPES